MTHWACAVGLALVKLQTLISRSSPASRHRFLVYGDQLAVGPCLVRKKDRELSTLIEKLTHGEEGITQSLTLTGNVSHPLYLVTFR